MTSQPTSPARPHVHRHDKYTLTKTWQGLEVDTSISSRSWNQFVDPGVSLRKTKKTLPPWLAAILSSGHRGIARQSACHGFRASLHPYVFGHSICERQKQEVVLNKPCPTHHVICHCWSITDMSDQLQSSTFPHFDNQAPGLNLQVILVFGWVFLLQITSTNHGACGQGNTKHRGLVALPLIVWPSNTNVEMVEIYFDTTGSVKIPTFWWFCCSN